MYVVTGDDEFDGAGVGQNGYNLIEDQVSDNFFNATLGVTLNLVNTNLI
jgi:OOP family OmpA-OmpF porin